MNLAKALIFSALALALAAAPAIAAPTLRAEVVVNADVVTAGDMFADAGQFADLALFRAPAPGTAGTVGLDAVRAAASRIGLTDYNDGGVSRVRVARKGVAVDRQTLLDLMQKDLERRGIIDKGMGIDAAFDVPPGDIEAAAVPDPVQLVDLRYMPASGTFRARFAIAGRDEPLDLTGRLSLLVPAPYLKASLPAGAILGKNDIEMRMVSAALARSAAPADLATLVGKQLTRQSRAGVMLKPSDIGEPQLVARNEAVTVYVHDGVMTLSLKGRALNSAAEGEPVQVLNPMSHRVLSGTAVGPGTVEIGPAQTQMAAL